MILWGNPAALPLPIPRAGPGDPEGVLRHVPVGTGLRFQLPACSSKAQWATASLRSRTSRVRVMAAAGFMRQDPRAASWARGNGSRVGLTFARKQHPDH